MLTTPEERAAQVKQIYCTIMQWLRDQPREQFLRIPVRGMLPPVPLGESVDYRDFTSVRILTFLRVTKRDTLIPGVVFRMKNGTERFIWYDPNWESYMEIDKLLEEE